MKDTDDFWIHNGESIPLPKHNVPHTHQDNDRCAWCDRVFHTDYLRTVVTDDFDPYTITTFICLECFLGSDRGGFALDWDHLAYYTLDEDVPDDELFTISAPIRPNA